MLPKLSEKWATNYWIHIQIVPSETKVPIVNESVGVNSLDEAFEHAKEIIELARLRWEE